jgi:hypothetical protein
MIDMNRVAALFLNTELSTGLTFAGIALKSRALKWPDKVGRNHKNARLAYDTVLRFRKTVWMTETESSDFDARFEVLRGKLRELGDDL